MPGSAALTVIGGFLGAGKTTLLNHFLQDVAKQKSGGDYAVLVNDFGDISIDENLIATHDGQTIALANGCICCTIGDDLVETLINLMEGPNPPRQILVETSGVANPARVSELGSLDPNLTRDLTIVAVDAEHLAEQWEDQRLRDTISGQLHSADLLVITKSDIATSEQVQLTRALLAQEAPEISVATSDRGRLPSDVFALDTRRVEASTNARPHKHSGQFQTGTYEVGSTFDLPSLKERLAALPNSVVRVKGFVCINDETRLVEKAGSRLFIRPASGDIADAHINRLVVISTDRVLEEDWFSRS